MQDDKKKRERIRSILGYLQEEGPPEQGAEPEEPDNDEADFTQSGEPAAVAGVNLKKKKKVPPVY